MPRRLFDPALIYSAYATIMVFAFSIAGIASWDRNLQWIACITIVIWTLFLIAGVFPNRRVNALYLRSFCMEWGGVQLMRELQMDLGWRYRVGSVSRPHTRMPVWAWPLSSVFSTLYYALNHRTMLEADSDWPARLWRSLGDCRVAFINMSKITQSILFELRIAYESLGPQRLFIMVPIQTPEVTWRLWFTEKLGISFPESLSIKLGYFEPHSNRLNTESRLCLLDFIRKLPAGTAGIRQEALPLIKGYIPSHSEQIRKDQKLAAQFLASLILPKIISLSLNFLLEQKILQEQAEVKASTMLRQENPTEREGTSNYPKDNESATSE